MKSSHAYWLAIIMIVATHLYYPRWSKSGTEATLVWDISGYYMYLPAIFIYQDIKECKFQDDILEKYHPTPDFQQAFVHEESGNHVMKYSLGQAIQFSPFFFVAHTWASNSTVYPADGFSFPYQFMISMGSLLIAFLGLFYLRKILLCYFEDKAVAFTLLGLVLGSNYLAYSAIGGAMTHNNLFTIYTLLIYQTIQFYRNPRWKSAILIGLLIGLAALTRPTEIIAFLIPVLWGISSLKLVTIKEQLTFLSTHIAKIGVAIVCCIAVGFLQLAYWKYATGDWIVYSYQDQGFSWLKPHIWDGIFSFKTGWLIYSPFMAFALVGFVNLWRQNQASFYTTLVFSTLFIYISFAWDIWWYGGSIGQRVMVQCYPILAFPLTAFFVWLNKSKIGYKVVLVPLILFTFYVNLWVGHQAHKGGMYHAGNMTRAYFLRTFGTFEKNPEHLKLLDTDELYEGERKEVKELYHAPGFYKHLAGDVHTLPSGVIKVPAPNNYYQWIRVSAYFEIDVREDNMWAMTWHTVRLKNGDKTVKERGIRVQRFLNHRERKQIYIDMTYPKEKVTHIEITPWNVGDKPISITDVKVEVFNEK